MYSWMALKALLAAIAALQTGTPQGTETGLREAQKASMDVRVEDDYDGSIHRGGELRGHNGPQVSVGDRCDEPIRPWKSRLTK